MIRSYYQTYKLDVAIARPFNTYGPRQNEGMYAAVIPITLRRLFAGQPPIIFGDGNQTRDFIYVEDTARGLIEVYKHTESRGKEINIAYGHEIKIRDLIKSIAKSVNHKGKFLRKPARLADVRSHRAETQLAKQLLNFTPKYNFGRGLEKTIEWYRQNLREI